MSDYGAYDDGPRRHRSTRYRPREDDDPDYIQETTYVERGKGPPPRDLMVRPRDDSVEDIPRDFPPPGSRRKAPRGYDDDYDDYPRRARSARGYDDDYDDYAAGGAAAGYAAGRRGDRDRGSRRGYYSDESEESPPPRRERRKSGIEKTLEGLGLGGVAGAIAGRSKSRQRGKDDSRSRSGSRSGEKGGKRERQWAQAAQAALVAGAIEAFRSRKEPGPWTGAKGRRIATAAIGAGGIDRLVDRDPDKKQGRHLVEAVIGGLAANRLANGPRDRGDRDDSRGRSVSRTRSLRDRSRSVIDRFRSKSRGRSASRGPDDSPRGGRSQSRGGAIAGLAAGGALAAGAKALYDRVRSKSRGAKERRRSTSSSADSYNNSRRNRRDVGRSRSMPPQDGADDSGAVVGTRGRAVGSGAAAGALSRGGPGGEKKRDSSTSSESSTDIENKRRKMKGKELLTAGLATIATIHAAHGVYQSMESSEKRHKLVAEGEMSKEEARRKRSKAWLQDAAAVGIAALGIKGAYSEWKEMNEQRHSVRELEERRRQRAKRRERRMREARESTGFGGGGAGPARGSLPPPHDYDDGGDQYGGDRLPPPPMGNAPSNGNYR